MDSPSKPHRTTATQRAKWNKLRNPRQRLAFETVSCYLLRSTHRNWFSNPRLRKAFGLGHCKRPTALTLASSTVTTIAPLHDIVAGPGRQYKPRLSSMLDDDERNIKNITFLSVSSSSSSTSRITCPGISGDVQITHTDVKRLLNKEMLNDTLIEVGLSFWFEGLKKSDPGLAAQIYIFSPFFYQKLNQPNQSIEDAYLGVRRWTRKVDIFQKKYLILPINEHLHWYLLLVHGPEHMVLGARNLSSNSTIDKTWIFSFDSLGMTHARTISMIASYLKLEASEKRGQLIHQTRVESREPCVPLQSNYYDCGIYLLHFTQTYISDPLYYHALVTEEERKNVPYIEQHANWSINHVSGIRASIASQIQRLRKG